MKIKDILSMALLSVVIAGCSHTPNLDKSLGQTPQETPITAQSQGPSNKEIVTDTPQNEADTGHSPATDEKNSTQHKALHWFSSQMAEEPDDAETIKADGYNDDDAKRADPTVKEGQLFLDEALEFCDLAQTFWQNGELDNALGALDNAYSLILEIDPLQDTKLIQQKEDLRFFISKRILEIYASRNIVVNGDHDEIPLAMNRYIQDELNSFTKGPENEFFCAAYQRSGFYRPYIVAALKKAGLPEELSWLPLIESGYKVKALSKARALGLWQFIPSTGYKFGLMRDRYVDERMDFIKSTDAAIAYLKELHSIFGDWSTVLAAYNCGEGRVLQVIRSQNINYLDNFWDLYERLPKETARYVPRFFATLHIVKNPQQYGFSHLPFESGLDFDSVQVHRAIQIKDISTATGIDLSILKILNPELRYSILPPESYHLRIPKNHDQAMLSAKIAAIPIASLPKDEEKAPEKAFVYHVVRNKESVGSIARRYRTSVSQIMKANNMRSANLIHPGKRLKVPQSGYVATQDKSVKRSPLPASSTHQVGRGDSLYNIAKRYDTTVKSIMSLNNLPSSSLSIGQKLKISGNTSNEPTQTNTSSKSKQKPDVAKSKSYKVKNGDSLFGIALKNKMEMDHFLRINKLKADSKIFPGQKLLIQ